MDVVAREEGLGLTATAAIELKLDVKTVMTKEERVVGGGWWLVSGRWRLQASTVTPNLVPRPSQ